MKKVLYTMLFCTGLASALTSCSNGEYTANPSSNANGSINPLTPLTSSQFTWSGTEPMSADINGVHWVADGGAFTQDSLFTNQMVGTKSDGTTMALLLANVWGGNLYNMGYHVYDKFGLYIDSLGPDPLKSPNAANAAHYYISYLGNSGEVKVLENDSAYIKGVFYFQGVNSKGQIINVTNGYFKLPKP